MWYVAIIKSGIDITKSDDDDDDNNDDSDSSGDCSHIPLSMK